MALDDQFDDDAPEVISNLPVPRTGLSPINPLDPSLLGFPPMLPVEIAMRTGTPKEICEAYGLTRFDFERIVDDPVFILAFNNAKEMLQKDGNSFKLKAKMQAEALLAKSWQLIHGDGTPAAVRADLIKATIRWAEYEPKKDGANGGSSNAFQININLGG